MKTRKIRIYFPVFPFPPRDGSSYVVYEQLQALSKMGFKVELVVWQHSYAEIEKMLKESYFEGFPSTVEWITLNLGKSETKYKRWTRVIRSFFSRLSSPEIYYYPPHFKSSLDQLLSPVDLAIYNYSFAYSWLKEKSSQLRVSSLESRRVVVFHNIESDLFRERQNHAQNPLIAWIHQLNVKKLQSHEVSLKNHTDELWFISPEDQENYQSLNLQARSRFLPPGFTEAFRRKRVLNFEKRYQGEKREGRKDSHQESRLGFIGKLDFLPNLVGVQWIIQELAPKLKQRGFLGEIWIAGEGLPSFLKAKAIEFPFIRFLGFIEDMDEFWTDIDVSLVPHFEGSGVRIKLLESLASGIPVLTTQGAVTRIHPDLRQIQGIWVSDQVNEWCDWILKYSWKELRNDLSQRPLPDKLNSIRNYSFMNEWME